MEAQPRLSPLSPRRPKRKDVVCGSRSPSHSPSVVVFLPPRTALSHLMSTYTSILNIHKREGVAMGKNHLRATEDHSIVDYIENGVVEKRYKSVSWSCVMGRYDAVLSDAKGRKQRIDDYTTHWVNDLLKGQNQFIVVAGKEDTGTKYILKGTSLNPGVVPLIEKRIASLCADSTMTAKVAYLRYSDSALLSLLC